jgi:hypothetical protein
MAIAGRVGITADLDPLVEMRGASGETCLFGEGPGGILLATTSEAAEEVLARAGEAGVDAIRIGTATGERLEIAAAELDVSVLLSDAETAWRSLDLALQG